MSLLWRTILSYLLGALSEASFQLSMSSGITWLQSSTSPKVIHFPGVAQIKWLMAVEVIKVLSGYLLLFSPGFHKSLSEKYNLNKHPAHHILTQSQLLRETSLQYCLITILQVILVLLKCLLNCNPRVLPTQFNSHSLYLSLSLFFLFPASFFLFLSFSAFTVFFFFPSTTSIPSFFIPPSLSPLSIFLFIFYIFTETRVHLEI